MRRRVDVFDSVRSIYRHFVLRSLPGGRKYLTLILLHHQLSFAMVIPMNLYFLHNRAYLRMVANLMGAGGVAVLSSNLMQLTDASSAAGLQRMRWSSAVTFLIMFWTRVVDFAFLAAHLLWDMYAAQEWVFFVAGAVCLGLMAGFNTMIIPDAYRRMRKFMRMSPDDFKAAGGAVEVSAAQAPGSPETFVSPQSSFQTTVGEEAAVSLMRSFSAGVLSVDGAGSAVEVFSSGASDASWLSFSSVDQQLASPNRRQNSAPAMQGPQPVADADAGPSDWPPRSLRHRAATTTPASRD